MKIINVLTAAIIFYGCSDLSTHVNEVVLNKVFELKVGDSAILSDQALTIKFKKVEEDSRCPINAICVWEGNATVVLELKNSSGDTLITNLNTSIEPKEADFSNLIIVLKNLAPYPKLNEAINHNDYIATLVVKNKEN